MRIAEADNQSIHDIEKQTMTTDVASPERMANLDRPALPALTGLRFFAALHVVTFHYGWMALAALPEPVFQVSRHGYVGVSLFFVLSGFVLAYNYLELGHTERPSFWVARAARVYPLYLLALAVALPAHLPIAEASATEIAATFALEAVLLQAWTPLTACGVNCAGWSLSAEAFFYAAFPWVLLWLRTRSNRALAATAVNAWTIAVALPAAYLLVLQPYEILHRDQPLMYVTLIYAPLLHLPQFAIGATAGIVYARRRSRGLGSPLPPWSGPAAAAASLAVLAWIDLPYPLVNNGLLAPLFAVLILGLADGRGWLARLLATRPMQHLGEASYAVYILQIPLAGWFSWATTGSWLPRFETPGTFLTFVALLVSISLASFTWIETPCRRRIRSFFAHR